MDLAHFLTRRYMQMLFATPRGRAHLLTQVSDAESNGESTLFDRAIDKVDDPELAKMVAKHRDDETRHAALFRARAEAQGVPVREAPAHLRIIDRLDRALGGFFDRPMRDRRDVMDAYLLLQVIEERAVTMFPIFEEAFATIDPETAHVFGLVSRDEERHLRYCHAIAKRYAPSPAVLASTLAEFRALETECFMENGRANMDYTRDQGLLEHAPVGALTFRAITGVTRAMGVQQRTPYWGTAPGTVRVGSGTVRSAAVAA